MATRRLESQTKTPEESLLPPRFAEFFARRGWTPREHQLALLKHAEAGEECSYRADRRRQDACGLSADAHRSRPAAQPARPAYALHSPLKALAVDVARNLETPIAEMGLADPRRDAHRRHAGLETPASAPRSARHSADDAGATRASAGQRRCALSFRRSAPRHHRRIACAAASKRGDL